MIKIQDVLSCAVVILLLCPPVYQIHHEYIAKDLYITEIYKLDSSYKDENGKYYFVYYDKNSVKQLYQVNENRYNITKKNENITVIRDNPNVYGALATIVYIEYAIISFLAFVFIFF